MMKFFTDKKMTEERYKTGFAMLFAVLASSLLIAIGVSIFNISLKELQIATSEQASQSAYYAADSAEECALYWDIKMGAFPACLDDNCNPSTPGDVSTTSSNTIVCNGTATTLPAFSGDPIYHTYTYSTSTLFYYNAASIIAPNAGISVTKVLTGNGASTPYSIETTIVAEGHNTGIIGQRVERGISETHNSQ